MQLKLLFYPETFIREATILILIQDGLNFLTYFAENRISLRHLNENNLLKAKFKKNKPYNARLRRSQL